MSIPSRTDRLPNDPTSSSVALCQAIREAATCSETRSHRRPAKCPLRASEVSRTQNFAVMELVSRDDVSQRPHRHFCIVRDPAARPGLRVHVSEQKKRGLTHRLELGCQL